MNLLTIGGLIMAWGALMTAVILDGASLSSFMKLAPAILVFGGTTGATVISFSMDQLKSLPAKTKRAFIVADPSWQGADACGAPHSCYFFTRNRA